MKTYTARPSEIQREWFIIDAEDLTLGRMATKVATILQGKHKPVYTQSLDTGDHVVIINAEKIRVTGNKKADKNYYRHTGYPGGIKVQNLEEVLEKRPEFAIEHAVKGMLPKGRLGRAMIKKMKVYAGPEHPHSAQMPRPLEV